MKRKKQENVTVAVLPPAERDIFPARKEAARRLRDQAAALVVNSRETLEAANVFVLNVKEKYREIHDAYTSIVDPLEESKRNTKALFDPVLKALAEAERTGKERVGEYLVAEKNRLEAEARASREAAEKANREAEQKRKKEADEAADRARQNVMDEAEEAGLTPEDAGELADLMAEDAKEAVLDAPVQTVQPKPVEAVKTSFSTEAGRMNAQFEYDYELLDVDALNASRPDLVEKTPRRRMILDLLKATNGAPIPGLRVTEKAKLTGTI